MLSVHAPLKFDPFRGDIKADAMCELTHHHRQLVKLGKLRDAASGERREALNDALHLIMAPRRFTSYSMGEHIELPTVEPRQA